VITALPVKDRIKALVTDYGWDKNDAQRVWDYGPEGRGPNMVVDTTKGV